MSGVYIKDMEMPEYCYDCPCEDGENGVCKADAKRRSVFCDRPFWCPLVPVPDHGRLIDGDVAEVINYMLEDFDFGFADGVLYAADWIAKQPTIIPADKEAGE